MANTRDTIGDQATLDGLVDGTLTALEESKITKLADYALWSNGTIESVSFPNLTDVGLYAFNGCTSLSSITAPNITKIGNYAFASCYSLFSISLQHVTRIGNQPFGGASIGQIILPACTSFGSNIASGSAAGLVDIYNNVSSMGSTLSGGSYLSSVILRGDTCGNCSTGSFNSTPIANGLGYIYVPSNLVDTYKSATNWSNYASQIVAIGEYPKILQDETITDTWAQIFEAESNGTYSTKYSVGDVKYMYLENGTPVPMQIVAFDADTLSAGGTAKITWISKNVVLPRSIYIFNNTSSCNGGWLFSDLRSWLRTTLWNQIDSTIRSNIKEVSKTYYEYASGSFYTSVANDTIWVPSSRELGINHPSTENNGPVYSEIFTNSASRIRRSGLGNAGDTKAWWTRSVGAYSTNNRWRYIGTGGDFNDNRSPNEYNTYFVIGFCT